MIDVVITIQPIAAPVAPSALSPVLVINVSFIMSTRRITFTFTPTDG
jgi:hypothetical protein